MESKYVVKVEEELFKSYRRQAIGVIEHGFNNGLSLRADYAEKETLCDLVGAYQAVRATVSPKLNGDFPPDVKEPFLDMYSLDVAARYAREMAGIGESDNPPVLPIDFSFSSPANRRIVPLLDRSVRKYLSEERRDVGSLLASISRTSQKGVSQESYETIKVAMDAFSLMIGDWSYNGLDGQAATPVLEREYQQIIGNEELLSGLGAILKLMKNYDPEAGSNNWIEAGIDIPRTALIVGPPGTGKSTALNQLFYQMQDSCAHDGLAPVYIERIDNTLKTKFQHDGVQKLNEKFKRIDKVPGIHLVMIDDADMVFFARNKHGVSAEEEEFSHQLMTRLEDGTGKKRKGNEFYALLCNHEENLDPALFGRAVESRFEALGPVTPAHFKDLFLYKLGRWGAHGLVQVPDWSPITEYALTNNLSGRDVKNISITLGQKALPLERLSPLADRLSEEECVSFIRSSATPIDAESILSEMRAYQRFKERKKEEAYEQMIQERVDQTALEFRVRKETERRIVEQYPEEEIL